jgi:hypothetical protein
MVVWNLNAVPAMQFSYNTVISMDHSPAYTALHCIREGRMRECGYSEHFDSNLKAIPLIFLQKCSILSYFRSNSKGYYL